ncbi:MAG: ATP-binding protein, partial [Myxococcota bacterium]
MAEHRSTRKGRRQSAGAAASAPTESAIVAEDTGSADRAAQQRIVELEAELRAARTTIKALLDKAEGRSGSARTRPGPGNESEIGKMPTQQLSNGGNQRVATDESGGRAAAASKLDRVVRQRTRALTESEAQLQRKNAELERLNQMKVEFISIATHELRTPLTSIVGYLDLMAEGRFGQMPPAMERPMASLRRNAHRLKRLVDDMLDVSRIDSGRITLYRRPCDLGEIVRHTTSAMESVVHSKKLELHVDIDAPPRINADADKIRQATGKLIANAIRHTPEGGKLLITVDTAPPELSAAGWARLRVKGDGGGVPVHLHSSMFEPFSDVHTARHHTSTGPDSAGLGLYIARGLIELHGGT